MRLLERLLVCSRVAPIPRVSSLHHGLNQVKAGEDATSAVWQLPPSVEREVAPRSVCQRQVVHHIKMNNTFLSVSFLTCMSYIGMSSATQIPSMRAQLIYWCGLFWVGCCQV